jgi:hypothetical protein
LHNIIIEAIDPSDVRQVNVFGIFDELQRASHQRMSKVKR